jgi:hypothetical protein
MLKKLAALGILYTCSALHAPETSTRDHGQRIRRQFEPIVASLPATGIIAAQPVSDEQLFSIYYPPAITSSIDESQNAVDFILDPPQYLAIVPNEPVTAGGEPGQFPVGESIASAQSWTPPVQAWLRGGPPAAALPAPPIVIPTELGHSVVAQDTIMGADQPTNDTAPVLYRRQTAESGSRQHTLHARQVQTCTMANRTGIVACRSTAVNANCTVTCAPGYYGASTRYQCRLVNGVARFVNTTAVATCLPVTLCSRYTCPGKHTQCKTRRPGCRRCRG